MILTASIIVTVTLVSFALGLFIGLCVADGYKSKRTCRECQRRLVRDGFSVDGEDYEVARRIVRGAEMLGSR